VVRITLAALCQGVKVDNYSTTPLFPTALEVSELGRALTKKEKSILVNMPLRQNNGNLSSENNYVLELPELATLKTELMEAVQHYMDTIVCAKPDIKAYITQSWVNRTEKEQYHHVHWHKNSYLSGVFYVEAVDGVDKITFYNKKESLLHVTPTEWNVYNSESWWYPIKTGSLLMFPSYLYHSVEKKNESNIRISLAFNTFLRGPLGDNFSLTELIL